MIIDSVELEIEGDGPRRRLVIHGRPYGLTLNVTARDLAVLAAWAAREAERWPPSPEETEA